MDLVMALEIVHYTLRQAATHGVRRRWFTCIEHGLDNVAGEVYIPFIPTILPTSAKQPPNHHITFLISSIDLQIQLHPTTDPVVLQRQSVLERSLPLPLQHDLVRLPPDPRRHLRLE